MQLTRVLAQQEAAGYDTTDADSGVCLSDLDGATVQPSAVGETILPSRQWL